jgi:hypothetical protein
MQEIQSSSYKKMSKRSVKYMPGNVPMRKLNTSAAPITKKSSNQMKKKSSKAFSKKATLRRSSKGTRGQYKSAMSGVTSGRPGAGKTFAYSSKGIDSRVMQISPAQRSGMSKRLSPTVAETPIRQNKKPVSNGPKSLAMFRKSIRRTMGY